RRPRKPRARPVPERPPEDPEQIRRAAELARLRLLLRPQSEEVDAVSAAAAAPAPRAPDEVDELRALETEIQGKGLSLGGLSPDRCAAQIAVWAGRARALQQGLSPEATASRRSAFRIFFERLTRLWAEMEAGPVDALSPAWSTIDWDTYVAMNAAVLEERPAAVPIDKQRLYHRTMLRSLGLPHRRTAAVEAQRVITRA